MTTCIQLYFNDELDKYPKIGSFYSTIVIKQCIPLFANEGQDLLPFYYGWFGKHCLNCINTYRRVCREKGEMMIFWLFYIKLLFRIVV